LELATEQTHRVSSCELRDHGVEAQFLDPIICRTFHARLDSTRMRATSRSRNAVYDRLR
jgi:hypothetical protein